MSDLIAIGNAFHRLVIRMKNKEFRKRAVFAVLFLRESTEDPRWERPLQN